MKKTIILLVVVILGISCKTSEKISISKSKKEWINSYKKYIIYQTIKKTGIDLNKDNSGVLQFEYLGADKSVINEIDSLSNNYSQLILSKPSYYEGKPIINSILEVYESKELDKVAKKSYKKHCNNYKP